METEKGEKVPSFAAPSNPLKIGYTLEKCACLFRGIGIKTRNVSLEENANKCLEIFKLEWTPPIAIIDLRTLDTK